MKRKVPTIKAEWAEFVEELLQGFTEEDLRPFEKCFYAGFLSMLAIAFTVSNAQVSFHERTAALAKLFEEHNEHLKEMV